MSNNPKAKGTRYEYDLVHALQMLSFYVIRSYSSLGVCDLTACPPWNPKGNYRPLLIQAKNSKKKDYVESFERDHLNYLQQLNSGMVILAYKDEHRPMIKVWDTNEKIHFDTFIHRNYGIVCSYSNLLKGFKNYQRPIQLYPPPKDINDKIVSSFIDPWAVDLWIPHVPEDYREKHTKISLTT